MVSMKRRGPRADRRPSPNNGPVRARQHFANRRARVSATSAAMAEMVATVIAPLSVWPRKWRSRRPG